ISIFTSTIPLLMPTAWNASSRTCPRPRLSESFIPPLSMRISGMTNKTGVLNINKPAGITSFDVVRQARRATGVRRVGHAGTLDPLATGVLLVCLGQATRIVSYLQDAPKIYLAGLKLGQRTTTYDAEGQVVEELPIPSELPLQRFTGDIWQ